MNTNEDSTETGKFYVLNLLSNLSSNYPAESEQALQEQANKIDKALKSDAISKYTGKWEVVWGPVLTCTKETNDFGSFHVADNTMYVTKSLETPDQYFIGVAGTNGISFADWFVQDFNVKKMKSWPASFLGITGDNQGNISEGTFIGVEALWKMKDPNSGSLIDFLRNEVAENSTISVGGHSLGGCLSPVLATAISDVLKPTKSVKIEAYPTAGPTPGDETFATHMANALDYYQADYNSNDLVPLAWCFDKSEMRALKENYAKWDVGGETINPNQAILKNFLDWAQSLGKGNGYVRSPEPKPANFRVNHWDNGPVEIPKAVDLVDKFSGLLEGVYNLDKLNNKQEVTDQDRENFARFFLEMGAQHVSVYAPQFNVPKEVSKAIGEYFKKYDPKTEEGSDKLIWIAYQMQKELNELAKRAAEWLYPSEEIHSEFEVTSKRELQQSHEDLEVLFGENGILMF